MGKAPKEKPAGFWKGLFGAFTELPLQTKLAGFFLLTFIGVLLVLSPKLEGWQVIALSGILVLYFAFSVWIHRPDRTTPVGPPPAPPSPDPPYAVLGADMLEELAAQPIVLLLALNAAAEALRTQIATVAGQVRKRKKNNSEADVWVQLRKVLSQPEPVVRALLAWADAAA